MQESTDASLCFRPNRK